MTPESPEAVDDVDGEGPLLPVAVAAGDSDLPAPAVVDVDGVPNGQANPGASFIAITTGF